jgi:hypothetical protein
MIQQLVCKERESVAYVKQRIDCAAAAHNRYTA